MKKEVYICILNLLILTLIVLPISLASDNSTNSQKVLPEIKGFSAKFPEEDRGYIFMNESEFYKDRNRSYKAGLPGGSFIPEPLKGEALNSYFKLLNLTEDYIYAMMQFETLDGDPTHEQKQILAEDNITLFEYHGDHTYYTKIPKIILETKSYDFVRWIGIVEDPSMKLKKDLKEKLWDKNCNGRIRLIVIFYENLNNKQFEKIKQVSDGHLAGYWGKHEDEFDYSKDNNIDLEIDINRLNNTVLLNFVKTVEVMVLPNICPPDAINCGTNPFEDINCTV